MILHMICMLTFWCQNIQLSTCPCSFPFIVKMGWLVLLKWTLRLPPASTATKGKAATMTQDVVNSSDSAGRSVMLMVKSQSEEVSCRMKFPICEMGDWLSLILFYKPRGFFSSFHCSKAPRNCNLNVLALILYKWIYFKQTNKHPYVRNVHVSIQLDISDV